MREAPGPRRTSTRVREEPATAALAELLPPPAGRAIADAFRRMSIAEEEICAAKARHRRSAGRLHTAFRYLCPPAALMGLDDRIYRAYCREILDRVAARENLKLGTAAEVIAALSRASLTAPPSRVELLLYSELFDRLFPTESTALLTDRWPSEPDACEREEMRRLEQRLRCRLSSERTPLT